jgi:hypothetical protein
MRPERLLEGGLERCEISWHALKGIPIAFKVHTAMQHAIEQNAEDKKLGSYTMPDIERSPAQKLANIRFPEVAPMEKMARPMLDPRKPTMVTLVSPMRGTKSRVPRNA